MRFFLATLLTFCFASPTPTIAEETRHCPGWFAKIGRELFDPAENESIRAAINRQIQQHSKEFGKGLLGFNKTAIDIAFYPVLGPVHLVKESTQLLTREKSRALWKIPFRVARKDGATLVGVASVVYMNNKLGITDVQFDKETNGFRSRLGQETYVYADLVPSDGRLAAVGKYEFQEKYAIFPNTHYVRATSWKELINKLQELRDRSGPIQGLVISAHGFPGGFETSHGKVTSTTVRNHPLASDLFSKEAKIMIKSCSVGDGKIGEKFTSQLGKELLLQGGTVYSSNVNLYQTDGTVPYLVNMGIPKPVAKAFDWTRQTLSSSHPLSMDFQLMMRWWASRQMRDTHLIPDERVRTTKIEARSPMPAH